MIETSLPLRQQIGGQSFLEYRSLSVSAIYLLTTSVVSNLIQIASQGAAGSEPTELLGLIVLMNLFSFLACLVLIILLKQLLAKQFERGLPVVVVMLLSFAIGALKGQVVSWLGISFGLFSSEIEQATHRWMQTGILGLLVLPILSLTIFRMNEIRANGRLVLSERLEGIQPDRGVLGSRISKLISELITYSEKELRKIESEIASHPESARKNLELFLDDLMKNQIRPISHKIWNRGPKIERTFTADWLTSQLLRTPLRYWLVSAGLTFLILLMAHSQLVTLSVAFHSALFMTIMPHLGAQIYRPFYRLPRSWKIALGLVGIILGTVLGGNFAENSGFHTDGRYVYWLQAVHLLLILQNLVGVSLAFSIFNREKGVREDIEKILDQEDLDFHAARLLVELDRRQFAEHLHSEVQNRILATSLLLNSNDSFAIERAVMAIRESLQVINEKGNLQNLMSWSTIETLLTQRWGGFVQLDFKIDPLLRSKIPRSGTSEMVNEAISNALRHGLSTTVSIQVTLDLDSRMSCVSVIDNGLGKKSGPKGLGLKLVDVLSNGNWSLTGLPEGGCALTCKISHV